MATSGQSDGSRRRAVLEAAAALFDERGYHATSLRDIADEAGLAKATLYHYFRSKDELLYEIHEEWIELLTRAHLDHLERCDDPAEQLRGVMRDILSIVQTRNSSVRVFFEEYKHLPTEQRARIKERRDRYSDLVRAVLERGVERGLFDIADLDLATFALFGICNWSYRWYKVGGRSSPEEVADYFYEILLRGFGTVGARIVVS